MSEMTDAEVIMLRDKLRIWQHARRYLTNIEAERAELGVIDFCQRWRQGSEPPDQTAERVIQQLRIDGRL